MKLIKHQNGKAMTNLRMTMRKHQNGYAFVVHCFACLVCCLEAC